jgi:UDP-N-acetylmuramate--alanine ligase
LTPVLAVVTNIENDHMDYYGTMQEVKAAFKQFINSVPFYGFVALCGDCPGVRNMLPEVHKPYVTYGLGEHNQLQAFDLEPHNFSTRFKVSRDGELLGEINLPLPGKFNVQNALAALAIGLEKEMDFNSIKQGLESFEGVARRFDFKGQVKKFSVYDDYAHHPTEIEKTLKAAAENLEGELLVIFQPHRYSRTRDLAPEFGRALKTAGKLCVTEVYPAGEEKIEGIDIDFLKENILPHRNGSFTAFASSRREILDWVEEQICPDKKQVLFTMGAGNIVSLAEPILDRAVKKMGAKKG